jgi:hypothetical protein
MTHFCTHSEPVGTTETAKSWIYMNNYEPLIALVVWSWSDKWYFPSGHIN